MPADFPSDAEIDKRAKARAAAQLIPYAEAVFAEITAARAALPTVVPTRAETSDDRLHAAALDHSRKNRVSYSEALYAVCPTFITHSASFREPVASLAPVSDQELHVAATRYAQSHRVSYSEALDRVVATFTSSAVNFREGVSRAAADAMEAQAIEIFKAGSRRDDSGTVRTITQADLADSARAYDRTVHEAPLVVGHPEHDAPAYGWVQRLEASADGRLLMHAHKVDPAFAEEVRAGRLGKRSVSFYLPTDPANPVPGVWYVRHVGNLGAMPPSVKGLADVRFGDELGGVSFTLETSDVQ